MSGRPVPLDPVEVVDLIAQVARACPAVAGLHGGLFGRCTTYLPGRRVPGVTLAGDGAVVGAVVGVVGRHPAGVAEIASQVRAAVGAVVPEVPVTVIVEDLLLPGERLPGDNCASPVGDAPGTA